MTRGKILWLLAALAAAFLGGFVPQYLETRRVRVELEQVQGSVRSLEWEAKLSRLRDLAARMHVEVAQKNYGLASLHSSRFFQLARELSALPEAAALRETLTAIVGEQDAVTAALAKADPAAAPQVQSILLRIQAKDQ